ncbi:hypothetical protein HHI36_018771 [Cryptolaemus montrouzieri]|uniref:Uncharacterized protein n=1 Tax=Cryptolaemus montrouzieri TaxID=559131 RepID=A0ABD2P0W1_9CUCU
MQDVKKLDKPKFSGSKPVIPSKPKYVPPVNLKSQKLPTQTAAPGCQRIPPSTNVLNVMRPSLHTITQQSHYSAYEKSYLIQKASPAPNINEMTFSRSDEYSISTHRDRSCNISTFEPKKTMNDVKPPNSPSTVCCSLLPNAAGDCCRTINEDKKDISSADITKVDSLDSNSSDSGGFKDFIQPTMSNMYSALSNIRRSDFSASHERKTSQPEVFDRKMIETRNQTHQRKASQPDLIYHESRSDSRQACVQNKPTVVPTAQALAHFLPSSEHKLMKGFSSIEIDATKVNKRLSQTCLTENRNNDDMKSQKPQISSHSTFHQSTKKLEELFSQRLEKEKILRKGGTCLVESENIRDIEEKMQVQKQIQQKLQADLQQTVKHIQEIQSTEIRLPQNRKWCEVSLYIQF